MRPCMQRPCAQLITKTMFNVTICAILETRGAVKPTKSEDVRKYTVIWKVCTGGKFSVKNSGNFRKVWNKFPEISGLTTLTTVTSCNAHYQIRLWSGQEVSSSWFFKEINLRLDRLQQQCEYCICPVMFQFDLPSVILKNLWENLRPHCLILCRLFSRDLRSFEIRFESVVRFDSKGIGRFENFRIKSAMSAPLLVVSLVKWLKPLTVFTGTVYRLASSISDHMPAV